MSIIMGKLGKLLLEDIHAHPTHEHTTIYILAVGAQPEHKKTNLERNN